jgi:hypothetical protein
MMPRAVAAPDRAGTLAARGLAGLQSRDGRLSRDGPLSRDRRPRGRAEEWGLAAGGLEFAFHAILGVKGER